MTFPLSAPLTILKLPLTIVCPEAEVESEFNPAPNILIFCNYLGLSEQR